MKKAKNNAKATRKGGVREPIHLRLPERSSLVRGKRNDAGELVERPDPRTASEDPTLKRRSRSKDQ
jgi:hypothetical protein